MSMGWVLSLLVAGIAHAIWVPAADYYLRHWGSGTRVDLGSVLFLLAGEYKDPKTQTCLYAGLLKSYEFSADGEIKRLTLEFAQRAEFSGNIEAITKFVAIPGDRFVIWCRDVNTLNVQYVTVDVAKDGSGASHQKELPLTLNP